MPITALYASLLALVLIFLSFRVIFMRRDRSVSLGDGADKDLLARIRSHANFTEYVPMALILMGLAEQLKASLYVLHIMGLLLVAGRLAHAFALTQRPQIMPLRAGGMVLTFAALLIGAVTCLLILARA